MPEYPDFPDGFNFNLPYLPPGSRKVTAEEAEKYLLEKAAGQEGKALAGALYQLIYLYRSSGRLMEAMELTRRIEDLAEGPEEKAHCYLTMGQIAEKMDDFAAAVDYYRQAFRLEPVGTELWYFVNNNLGYSLNQLGRFVEAECFCRAAIEINLERYNAYKNLGIALEGQDKPAEAAALYIQAVKLNAGDRRAFIHLLNLLERNPQLLRETPSLVKDLEDCGEAVTLARRMIDKLLEEYNNRSNAP